MAVAAEFSTCEPGERACGSILIFFLFTASVEKIAEE